MTLRLVLVSLVAALGLTVPGAPVIESWVASTQNWMNARFADWDTRNPEVADYVIVSDYYDVERLAPRLPICSAPATVAPEPSDRPGPPMALSVASTSKPARLQTVQTASVRPVSILRQARFFAPVWVDEDFGLGIVMELSSKKPTIVAMPVQAVQKPAASVWVDPMPAAGRFYQKFQLELIQWGKTLASLLPGLNLSAPAPRRSEPVATTRKAIKVTPDKAIQLGQGIGINPPMAVASKRDVTSAVKPDVTVIAKPAVAPKATVAVNAKPVVAPKAAVAAISKPAVAPKASVAVAPKPALVVAPKPAVAVAPKPALAVAPKPALAVAPKPALAVASRPTATTLSRTVGASPTSFAAMETSANLYFAGKLTVPVKNVAARTPSRPAMSVTAPVHSPGICADRQATADLEIDLADELVPFDDGFAVTATIRKPSVTGVKPSFDPLEVDYEFYVGTSFELNLRHGGLQQAADPVIHTAKTDTSARYPTPDLSRAVKLTRDAVYAWVNVFTGPALVTVSQGR